MGSPFPSSWFRQIAEVHVQAEAERGKGSSKKPDWGSPRIPYQLEVVIHHRALRTDNDLFPGRWCWDALWFLGSGVDAMTRRSKLERERRKTAARSQSNEERDPLILVWVVALHTNNGLFPGRRFWSAGWILLFWFLDCCSAWGCRRRWWPVLSLVYVCFPSFVLLILRAAARSCIVTFLFSFFFLLGINTELKVIGKIV